ncbi:hypothetical protein CDD81_1380 [Ophiocordyceps australis]|uniref:Uncharacterized protein n=1 Tax=Ophiocordyceps australis TaxID=1399860 RepID=A0A2C5X837_9HYPO|nr:hypothetical protein CDD81_1380 [Ophiocordyceps australis]
MLRLNHPSSYSICAQPSIIWQRNRRLATTRLYRQESAAQQSPIEEPVTPQNDIQKDSVQKQDAGQTSSQAETSSGQQNRTTAASEPQSKDGTPIKKHSTNGSVTAQPTATKRSPTQKQENNPAKKRIPPKPIPLIRRIQNPQSRGPRGPRGPLRIRRNVPNSLGAASISPIRCAPHHKLLLNASSISLREYIDILDKAGPNVSIHERTDPVVQTWQRLLKTSEALRKTSEKLSKNPEALDRCIRCGVPIEETPALNSTPDSSNQDQEGTLSTAASSSDETDTHLSISPGSQSEQAPPDQNSTSEVGVTQGPSFTHEAPLSKSSPEGTSTRHVSHQAVKLKGAAVKEAKDLKASSNLPSIRIETVDPINLKFTPLEDSDLKKVPFLQYNLDRVLFQCGVQQMQDERTGVFNFDPYLATIMPAHEFDFDALKDYVTSSKDGRLRNLASKHGTKYCGSTSSMTAVLSHFHYLISAWRLPNFGHVSRSVSLDMENFTVITRAPAAAYLAYKDGVYAIDADKQFDSENILSMLGKSMEKLLTLPKKDYEKYRRTKSHTLPPELRDASETYHYSKMGDLLMRSQLDAKDPRLPGAGIFDLKTRAVVSIRMDVRGYQKGVGYEIRKPFGEWQSFEREYYDMIRAAFLKYSLQVRMGRMDGIFVAFHNTQRIFGFQYYTLKDMDWALHGTHDTRLGDQEFTCSLKMLNHLMNIATQRFPGRTLRIHVETRPIKTTTLYFFAEPISDEQMHKNQTSCKPLVERLENELRGMTPSEAGTQRKQTKKNEDEESTKQPDDGEKVVDDESLERAIEVALSSVQAKEGASKDQDGSDEHSKGSQVDQENVPELLGLSVTLRNYVNGCFVRRATIEEEDSQFDWKIQYAVNELSYSEAQATYKSVKNRRRTVFSRTPAEASRAWQIMFRGQLRRMSEEGARHRRRMTSLYKNKAVRVAWNMKPLPNRESKAAKKQWHKKQPKDKSPNG